MTTTPKSRKRLPPTTEMGRQLMKLGREKMAEEAAATAERFLTESAARRNHEEQLEARGKSTATNTAVQRGLLTSIVGSLASEDITPIIDVQPLPSAWTSLEAWTDFHRIHIRYHNHPDPRVLAAVLRGLMYHEGGHIRWTIAFPDLRAMVNDDLAGRTGTEIRSLQNAWNALEDQRMETAVVSDSPRKAAFLTPLVLTEILDTPRKAQMNYPLLVWRRYLPRHIRMGARALFVDAMGEARTVAMEETVDAYVRATTAADMWAAVVRFDSLVRELPEFQQPKLPGVSEQHTHQTMQGEDDGAGKMEIPIDPSMEADEAQGEDEGAGAGAPGEEADEAGEEGQAIGGGDGEGEEAKTDATSGQDEAGQSGTESGGDGAGDRSDTPADHTPGLTQEDLDEAQAKAEDERYNDRALDADVDAFYNALDRLGSKLAPYTLTPSTDLDSIGAAEALTEDLVQSFNMATQDRVPAWVDGQRTGILNVGRYITRQPGDMEYFKQWTDDDLPGYNLAVSVLLDYSGSMRRSMPELAQVGYACKAACDRLEIPCTVTLWDDDAVCLWDGMETAEYLPEIAANGNTDPSMALADLDNQRFGKTRHLVIVMTDGTWSWGNRTLAPYCADGRMMLGIGFGKEDEHKAQRYAKALRAYGCPDSFPVTDLTELPWLLENLLVQMA